MIGEYTGQGTLIKRYSYLPDSLGPLQMEDSRGIYDVHNDHIDTPLLLTDSSQIVVWQLNQSVFGNRELADLSMANQGYVGSVEYNIRFPGQYYDSESGLHYNYFRDYDPSVVAD